MAKVFGPDGTYLGEARLEDRDLQILCDTGSIEFAMPVEVSFCKEFEPKPPGRLPTVRLVVRDSQRQTLTAYGVEHLHQFAWFWDKEGRRAWREAEQRALEASYRLEAASRTAAEIAAAGMDSHIRSAVEAMARERVSAFDRELRALRNRARLMRPLGFRDEVPWLGTGRYVG